MRNANGATVAPDPSLEEDDTSGKKQECIFCPCRPEISFCGKWVPGVELSMRTWYITDDSICDDCRHVAVFFVCPYCLESFTDGLK